jgi:integrase
MATITKRTWRSGGQERSAWRVDYRDQQGKRRARQFPTQKAAKDFLVTASYEVRLGTHTPASQSITVAKAVEQWLARCEAEGLEYGTILVYRTTVEHHVLPYLGTVKLAQLTRPEIEKFKDRLMLGNVPDGKARSRTTAANALGRLKSAIKDAQRRGQVGQNVASGVTVKTGGRHKRKLEIGRDIPDKPEVRAILAAAGPRWRPMLIVATFCGLRASELRGLRWQDVDLERKLLKVRQRASLWCRLGSPKSEAGERDIPMAPIVLNTLREWRLAARRAGTGIPRRCRRHPRASPPGTARLRCGAAGRRRGRCSRPAEIRDARVPALLLFRLDRAGIPAQAHLGVHGA